MVETEDIQLRSHMPRGIAVRYANEIQRLYDVLARWALPCAAKPGDDPIGVSVLPAWQFEQFVPGDVAGFYRRIGVGWLVGYRDQIILPDDLGAQSKQLFLHEVTHRLVRTCFVAAPDWLNEGLAGFFETMVVDAGRVTFGRPPYLIVHNPWQRRPRDVAHNGQRLLIVPFNDLPSIESIVNLTDSWRTHDWAETAPRYAIAWALVHFLELGAPDLTARFKAYLAGLQQPGSDPREVFAKTFEGVPLQDRLEAYLRRGEFAALQSSPSALELRDRASNARVREMAEEEGHFHLAWLSSSSRAEQQRERFVLHLAAAKKGLRTRNAAFLLAAFRLYANGDTIGAEREVQEALREAPGHPELLEAQLDILLSRDAPIAELQQAAARLRPVARTGGQFCLLASVALRAGDRKAALEAAARGRQLDPTLVRCWARIAREAAQP